MFGFYLVANELLLPLSTTLKHDVVCVRVFVFVSLSLSLSLSLSVCVCVCVCVCVRVCACVFRSAIIGGFCPDVLLIGSNQRAEVERACDQRAVTTDQTDQ